MSVRVTISNRIYPPECLEEAIAAYTTLCSVQITGSTSNARDIEITPLPQQASMSNEATVAHEFLNYLLDLSLEHHLEKI